MNVMEVLLSKRWIVKAKEKELYYRVKDELPAAKKFLAEKLGYQVIVNPYLIKLEKIPTVAQPWMGIQDFTEPIHYEFLCLILAFLEDKETEEQFVLSQLTEFIKMNHKEEPIDWTLYSYRRNLIKVLKFCIQNHFFLVDDGTEDSFRDREDGEVLYENTGVSRYFMRSFATDLSQVNSIEDYEGMEWTEGNEDRGVIRRQKVYRNLLLCPAVYKSGETDEEFAYIKNYRNMIMDELNKYMECELQVHRTSAYLVIGENVSIGKEFPESNTVSDVILLTNQLIRKDIGAGRLTPEEDETIVTSISSFQSILEQCKQQFGNGFLKKYREMETGEFTRLIFDKMEQYEFISVNRQDEEVTIRPIAGKLIGRYPKEYQDGGQVSEQQMAD